MTDETRTTAQLREEITTLRAELQQYRAQAATPSPHNNQQDFRDLLEHAHDLIQSVDPNGRFLYVNRAWRDTLQYDAEDIADLRIDDILAPSCREHCLKQFQLVMAGTCFERIEAIFRTKHGQEIHVEGNINCKFSNGQALATRGIFRNMGTRKEVEAALRSSEAQYRGLFESLQDVFFRTDQRGNIILVSPSIVQLLGYTQEDACTLNMERDILILAESWKRVLKLVEENRYREEVEVQLKRWDGSLIWCSATAQWYTDEDGHILGIEGILRDITRRKHDETLLKLNKERLEALVNLHHMHESSIEEIMEYTLEKAVELTGSTVALINHVTTENERLVPSIWSKGIIKTAKPTRTEYVSVKAADLWDEVLVDPTAHIMNDYTATHIDHVLDGYADLQRVLIVPVYHEDELVLLSAVANKDGGYDDTDRHELTLLMGGMWNHIKAQMASDELHEANEQLQKLNASKDTFFSIIAHDLRGPLSSLHELTQHIEENLDSYALEELKELIVLQKVSAETLYKLLENLLTWSRVQRGVMPYQPQPINIRWFIARNINLLTLHAKKKHIALVSNVQHELCVFADFNMVDTIIRNLISNAIKFTEPGGEVSVSVHDCEHFVEVAVADSGIGIEEQYIPTLFRIDTRYKRLGTGDEEGSGLGLILCKEFVDKHQCRIWVESEIGQGTTFRFTLPKMSEDDMVVRSEIFVPDIIM